MTPLSHIGAILAVDGVHLKAVVDPSDTARTASSHLWEDRTSALFAQSIKALGDISPNVVVLCTPTSSRERDALEALKLSPNLLVVEKPLATSVESARRILRAAEDAGVALLVNYNRRFDPSTTHFRSLFPGTPVSIVGRYGKGLANYASHMVDLLGAWHGPVTGVQAISDSRALDQDLSVSFRMRFESGPDAYVLSLDDLSYDQFEIDFFFADRQMSYLAGGAERQLRFAKPDIHYRGYKHLTVLPDETWHGQIGGFVELYGAIRDHFSEARPLEGCSGPDAIQGLEVLEAVEESSRKGGQVVRV